MRSLPQRQTSRLAAARSSRRQRPAARIGAVGRSVLHARYDGHGSQPGLNDDSVQGLIAQTQNPRFAWDSYRRFIQMFSNRRHGRRCRSVRERPDPGCLVAGVRVDSELSAEDLQELVETFKGISPITSRPACIPSFEVADGKPVFPHDPELQLRLAIQAAFGSWMNERACIYRKQHGISDELGTAVNVQAMAFATRARHPRPASPSRATRPMALRILRRLSGQRPGRGRRRRHPQH
ncbi:MAG: PEP/pyruvate-binding domain-containing protein [Collinsella sp.]